MQRADKIALIVASTLVLLLAAGAVFLLVQRNTTLANERPAEESVKLTQLEEPKSAETVTPEPVKAPAPTVPVKPKGYDFGFVNKVGTEDGGVYIKWDPAELLTGKEADLYAKKQGKVLNTELYYIANATKKVKTYDVTSKSVIIAAAADGTTSTISAAEFNKQWNAGGAIRKRPWFLFIEDGVVRRMVQVVLPKPST